jgi:hypothetical protein
MSWMSEAKHTISAAFGDKIVTPISAGNPFLF